MVAETEAVVAVVPVVKSIALVVMVLAIIERDGFNVTKDNEADSNVMTVCWRQ